MTRPRLQCNTHKSRPSIVRPLSLPTHAKQQQCDKFDKGESAHRCCQYAIREGKVELRRGLVLFSALSMVVCDGCYTSSLGFNHRSLRIALAAHQGGPRHEGSPRPRLIRLLHSPRSYLRAPATHTAHRPPHYSTGGGERMRRQTGATIVSSHRPADPARRSL